MDPQQTRGGARLTVMEGSSLEIGTGNALKTVVFQISADAGNSISLHCQGILAKDSSE
jgi:hypothetical protein